MNAQVSEYREEFLKLINKEQNFLKHADRDPDAVLEFKPELTAGVLLDCAQMYRKYTGRNLREGSAFGIWYSFAYPKVLKSGEYADAVSRALAHQDAALLTHKPNFLELLARRDLWQDAD